MMFAITDLKKTACLLVWLLAATCAGAYEPTSNYDTSKLEGWTILVNKQLTKESPAMAKEVMQVLDHQLFQISRAVPQPALARLRDVAIWVEVTNALNPCACYHPSGGWLRQHDMNPEKSTSVEISCASNFLLYVKDQPWMVLHELAHSYHHRVLGYDNQEIKAAYRHALESKSYESVLNINGTQMRHYALNNEQEYFAECSEAFFGVNDFYPFVRAELQQHDPGMYALLMKVWGVKSFAAAPVVETESATARAAR